MPTNYGIKFERLNGGLNGIKQVVNHFEQHKEISTKSGLIKNLQIYCETNKLNLFDITPVTFLIDLQDDNCEAQLGKFVSFFLKNNPKRKFPPITN